MNNFFKIFGLEMYMACGGFSLVFARYGEYQIATYYLLWAVLAYQIN